MHVREYDRDRLQKDLGYIILKSAVRPGKPVFTVHTADISVKSITYIEAQ